MRRLLSLLIWRTLAMLCLLLGLVGVFVPGLPTVPFMLLAAWAGSKGWPALETWLLNHPRHGPPIRRWPATSRSLPDSITGSPPAFSSTAWPTAAASTWRPTARCVSQKPASH